MDTRRPLYSSHKSRAKARGIAFELTFDEWCAIWGDKIWERGRGADQYCMARKGDEGPYAVGNVSIVTFVENMKDRKKPANKDKPRAFKLPQIRVICVKNKT